MLNIACRGAPHFVEHSARGYYSPNPLKNFLVALPSAR